MKRYATMFDEGKQAAARYCEEVRSGAFPDAEHAFGDVKKGSGVTSPTRPKYVSSAVSRKRGYGPEA